MCIRDRKGRAPPNSRTSQPVAGNANTVPSEIALMMSAVARDRRSGGTQREIMFMEAGNTLSLIHLSEPTRPD